MGAYPLQEVKHLVRGELWENKSLAEYTTWRVGGLADYVYLPADLADLAVFLSHLPTDLPVTWLGLGSNTLIRDGGVRGVVILTLGSLNQLLCDGTYKIHAEAGVSCAQLARYTARQGLTGLEFMAGIPGTVGGALVMNAGCFGGETWNFVQSVETINLLGNIRVRQRAEFQVGYRHVVRPQNEWFVAGNFMLTAGDKEKSLSDIRSLLEKRNATQPTGSANCGSVFRNPPGNYAGRLIEECGLKGKIVGDACVSEKHANFIINRGQAKAQDIENLIAEVQAIVEKKTGVRLMAEVCVMGELVK